MKNKFLALAITGLVVFSGCGSDDPVLQPGESFEKPRAATLKFKRNNVTVEPSALTQVIDIETNVEYEIKEAADYQAWLSYTLRGNELFVTLKPNSEEVTKSASLIIWNEKEELSDTLYITQAINKERLALIQIYKALNGDEWINNENWCSDKPLSEWKGILANGDVEVTRLYLNHDAFIKGEIPTAIGALKHLKDLSFELTQVYGELPSVIGELTNLTHLTMGNCNLSGKIPESLVNCKLLETMDFSSNNFGGAIPEFIFQCPELSTLRLDGNHFKSFELKDVPACKNLQSISINDNELSTSIPPNLFKIKGLYAINAQNNQLSGTLPPEIGEALNLHSLYLYRNNLTGRLPQELLKLPLLESFSIFGNYLDVANTAYLSSHPYYSNWVLGSQKGPNNI